MRNAFATQRNTHTHKKICCAANARLVIANPRSTQRRVDIFRLEESHFFFGEGELSVSSQCDRTGGTEKSVHLCVCLCV